VEASSAGEGKLKRCNAFGLRMPSVQWTSPLTTERTTSPGAAVVARANAGELWRGALAVSTCSLRSRLLFSPQKKTKYRQGYACEGSMASWLKKIGRAVLIIREIKEMSRGDLALAAGITRSQLSSYEHGGLMQLETLSRLLQTLDVPPDAFFLLVTLLDAPPTSEPFHRWRLGQLASVLDLVGGARPLALDLEDRRERDERDSVRIAGQVDRIVRGEEDVGRRARRGAEGRLGDDREHRGRGGTEKTAIQRLPASKLSHRSRKED
jgi:transcriptional regulator with XRE-family HTH domain